MQLTESHKQYWSKNLRMTAFLLSIWFVVTFVVGFYARELNFNFFDSCLFPSEFSEIIYS